MRHGMILALCVVAVTLAACAREEQCEIWDVYAFHGSLTYHERVMLPYNFTIVMELIDSNTDEVLVEQVIEMPGQQVPIPFDIAAGIDPNLPAPAVVFEATLYIEDQPRWISGSVPVSPDQPDLGEILLTLQRDTLPEVTTSPAISAASSLARGNEPGWHVTATDTDLTLVMDYGARILTLPILSDDVLDYGRQWTAQGEDNRMTLSLSNLFCTDDMSGEGFEYQAELTLNGQIYRGCGGRPMSIDARQTERFVIHDITWQLEDLNGAGLVDESHVTLRFDADGRAGGRASCNHYSAQYELRGDRLSLSSQIISTMMACISAPLMQQERDYLGLLPTMEHVRAGEEGRLILSAPDGRSLTFRRGEDTP